MGSYYVEIPIVLKLMVSIEAESREDAREKVLNSDINIDINDEKKEFESIDYEWDIYERIVQGNVYYGIINEMSIEEDE